MSLNLQTMESLFNVDRQSRHVIEKWRWLYFTSHCYGWRSCWACWMLNIARKAVQSMIGFHEILPPVRAYIDQSRILVKCRRTLVENDWWCCLIDAYRYKDGGPQFDMSYSRGKTTNQARIRHLWWMSFGFDQTDNGYKTCTQHIKPISLYGLIIMPCAHW